MEDIVSKLAAALLGAVVYSLIISLPVWWLWNNCLVGTIDMINEIPWHQTFGVCVLIGLFRIRINL